MKNAVDDLVAWKSKVSGGMMVMSALMGLAMWMMARTFEKSDEVTAAIISMERELAVFRQEVKPFITAGPRFTSDNYKAQHEVDEARIKEWVRGELNRMREEILSHE